MKGRYCNASLLTPSRSLLGSSKLLLGLLEVLSPLFLLRLAGLSLFSPLAGLPYRHWPVPSALSPLASPLRLVATRLSLFSPLDDPPCRHSPVRHLRQSPPPCLNSTLPLLPLKSHIKGHAPVSDKGIIYMDIGLVIHYEAGSFQIVALCYVFQFFCANRTDIVDEAITFFRANVFFRNFDIKSSVDKLLIYLTFYFNVALKRLEGCRTLAEGTKAIINLGLEKVHVPGEPGFPLPGLFPLPQSDKEAGETTFPFTMKIVRLNSSKAVKRGSSMSSDSVGRGHAVTSSTMNNSSSSSQIDIARKLEKNGLADEEKWLGTLLESSGSGGAPSLAPEGRPHFKDRADVRL
ncbi:hypothetical protein ACLB2K_027170 [Fragaria x ananassa]